MRAGLGMLDGALKVLPCAKVSVAGLERTAIIIAPMLATGGSAIATIDFLKESGCKHIIALFLVAHLKVLKHCKNFDL